MNITVEQATPEKLEQLGVLSWPIWTKEASDFDWEYETGEICYFLQGRVKVTTVGGAATEFGRGDLVVFPKGLKCTWHVLEAVEKHYLFE